MKKNNSGKGRVLFIHHGGIAGGAPLSMLYTMQGVHDDGYTPIAALRKPMPELHELYNNAGFETIETPWIPMFITWSGSEGKWWNPITWKGVYGAFKMWAAAKTKLTTLIKRENIDLVHLNSVGLSNCAEALMEMDHPFVWHVREHGPSRKGKRYQRISSTLAKAENVVFLSKAERESWLNDDDHGTVVHNFIDFDRLSKAKPTAEAKKDLGIAANRKVILYVGGSKSHKGVLELLDALGELKRRQKHDFVCLMPDSAVKSPGQLTKMEKKIAESITVNGLEENCELLPFTPDIINLFAACDVLVFPATKPHFARPVIEASAMSKPAIASDLKAIDELIIDGKTGYLIPAGDVGALTNKMTEVFDDPVLAAKMGEAGRQFALEEFEFHKQIEKILHVYDKALAS